MTIPANAREEFAAHWRVVAAATIGVAFGISSFSFVMSQFVDPMRASFGWSREAITNGAAGLLLGALTAPLVGMAIDRWGVRRVVFVSSMLSSLAFMGLAALGSSIWGYYITLNILFIVGGGITPISYARAIASWFRHGLGLALAIVLSGVSLAGFILPPILAEIIHAFGWRAGYVFMGLLPVVVALPLSAAWLRERALDAAMPRDDLPGLPLGMALRTRAFWVMTLAVALVTMPALSIMSVLEPLLTDRGFTPGTAAWLISVLALAVLAGRLVVGVLFDRFWAPGVAAMVLIGTAAGPVILLSAHGDPARAAFALALIGVAQATEINLLAFLIARYFGDRAFASIYGAINVVFGMAIAAGVIAFGALYAAHKSYDMALMLASGCLLASGLLFPLMGRYPGWARAAP